MSPDLVLERTSRVTDFTSIPRFGFSFVEWSGMVELNQAYGAGTLSEWPAAYRTPREWFYRSLRDRLIQEEQDV